MPAKPLFVLAIRVDKLTNSLELAATGESFATVLTRLTAKDAGALTGKWVFNWQREARHGGQEVYQLTTVQQPGVVQGLLSVERKSDHVFMHLVEVAGSNRGANRVYRGVLGNLVAFACKLSFESKFEGFVAFDAKTKLINHYKNVLGATPIGNIRMVIETEPASTLVLTYFKDFSLNPSSHE